MKERPILFSGEMVRAILDGRKSQTRRVIKPQPKGRPTSIVPGHCGYWHPMYDAPNHAFPGECAGPKILCRHGLPGDRLWVRETHSIEAGTGAVTYAADGSINPLPIWKPSIHMPRWASRITLEIQQIRVQRLRKITRADAEAEAPPSLTTRAGNELDPVSCFAVLWDNINGYGSWNSDPWVWVIEFTRVK